MQSVSAGKNRADTGLHQVPNFTSHLSTSDWMWWAGGSNGVKVNCEVFGSRCVRSVPPACRTCIFVSFHTGRLLPGSYVRLRPWERLVPADRELPVRAGFNRRGADIQTSRDQTCQPASLFKWLGLDPWRAALRRYRAVPSGSDQRNHLLYRSVGEMTELA